jgi:uncharacterized protein YyaL (SSP411 family)
MQRRRAWILGSIAFACTATCAPQAAAADDTLLEAAANSLIARHVQPSVGGWAWHSVIQAPNLQVDRDVGAASSGMGLLAAYETTNDATYLNAAAEAGTWLLAVAQPANGGLRWPDYDNGGKRISPHHYSSFDDGAAGISDFLWRLYAATGNADFSNGAVAGMTWLESQAHAPAGSSCPQTSCYWIWDDYRDNQIFTGMGEGVAGIAYAFDTFAQETGDSSYESYALAAASWLEAQIAANGAIPEHPGTKQYDTGYLSGSAGDAFLFARLYQRTGNVRWLNDAETLESFVRAQGKAQAGGGTAWPIEVGHQANAAFATGIEEGAAGIGWVELQLYALTGNAAYLGVAESAGTWLLSVETDMSGGVCWAKNSGGTTWHTSLDNGAPGIGWFLYDLSLADGNQTYDDAALAAQTWLQNVAFSDTNGSFWYENFTVSPQNPRWHLAADPSWHWGLAGIAAYFARLDGWTTDIPGEQPGL